MRGETEWRRSSDRVAGGDLRRRGVGFVEPADPCDGRPGTEIEAVTTRDEEQERFAVSHEDERLDDLADVAPNLSRGVLCGSGSCGEDVRVDFYSERATGFDDAGELRI